LCDVIPPTHPPVPFYLFFPYDEHLDQDVSGFCPDLNHYDYGMEQLELPVTWMHKRFILKHSMGKKYKAKF
jgi:hypothetical protein